MTVSHEKSHFELCDVPTKFVQQTAVTALTPLTHVLSLSHRVSILLIVYVSDIPYCLRAIEARNRSRKFA